MKKSLRRPKVEGRAPARPRPGRSPALRFALCLLSSALCHLVSATEPADLGQGLGYLRVQSLDEAVKPLAGGTALVLDLRRAVAPPEAMAPFSAALSARPAGSRLFVLVSPATPKVIADALPAHLLTLGIKGSQPAPRVVVAQSADDDRRACDALAEGTPLAGLISGKIDKERFDEASLVQEFNGGHVEGPSPAANASPDLAAPARLTDRVLQRAVHLHRALLALKR